LAEQWKGNFQKLNQRLKVSFEVFMAPWIPRTTVSTAHSILTAYPIHNLSAPAKPEVKNHNNQH